jgi:Phosphate transporter family
MIILVLLVVTALAFDFTNGFHDTGNAMATSIATGALKPKVAVLLAGVLNLVGAFLSVEVAATVTTQVLKVQDSKTGHLLPSINPSVGLTIIFAGLIGGILWNLFTWLFGIPSSSSHALFGGLIGAGLAAIGSSGVNWSGNTQKVLIPAVAAPDRGHRRRVRHLADVPDHAEGSGKAPRRRTPLGPDRHGLAGRAGARHKRRAEDDGRDRPRADHHRASRRRHQAEWAAVLDPVQLRAGDRSRHLHRGAGGSSAPSERAWWRSSRRRGSRPRRRQP